MSLHANDKVRFNGKKRRHAKLHERVTPCQCCGYFLSHRHHLLPVSEWKENGFTVQLCANCHELYHILYTVYDGWRTQPVIRGRSASLYNYIQAKRPAPDAQIFYLTSLVFLSFDEQISLEERMTEQNRLVMEIFEDFFANPDSLFGKGVP